MCNAVHPFEAAGLGAAPFSVAGWYRDVGPKPIGDGLTTIGAPGQPMGTCQFCGQGIAICVQIRAADGQRFVVGCDCAKKVHVDVREVRRAIRNEAAEAKREAARLARVAKAEAELQSQRDANGGLTDQEVEQARLAELAVVAEQQNAWLIRVLESLPYDSGFVADMIHKLKRFPLSETHYSDRTLSILADIYAKQHGRRGSKKYDAAYFEFEDRTGE